MLMMMLVLMLTGPQLVQQGQLEVCPANLKIKPFVFSHIKCSLSRFFESQLLFAQPITYYPQVTMFGGAMLLSTDDFAKNAMSLLRL